jgi:transposase InsO family protein
MTITMNDSHLMSIAQIKEFLKFSQIIEFAGVSQKEKYLWLENILNRFRYFGLKKKDRGIVKIYIIKMIGYSDSQLGKLIRKKHDFGKIKASSRKRNSFPTTYTTDDIALLVKTDNAHERLAGRATKEIFIREYERFKNLEYSRLKNISISHIYNLRVKNQYVTASLTYTKTQANAVPIGERRKPYPDGKPGYIRVDSVHQGDLDKEKGVYHINMVDEVTQWEIVGAVEKISEQYLEVLLEELIKQFPFRIINFHSDNGSEYINKTVAKLLNKLVISQTKSRSGKCNDQALVECKNGSVIRKHMGRSHISQINAGPINAFYRDYFNVYLNYHRPSSYATVTYDGNGKRIKKYNTCLIPYEKLKSLEKAEEYLVGGVTFAQLDVVAYEKSDNEYAALMQEKKKELFNNFII